MQLPKYKLIGEPKRYRNGRGLQAKYYAQKFRILTEPPRKYRSVSLATRDIAVARANAKDAVEGKIRQLMIRHDPLLRTKLVSVHQALDEYINYLSKDGNTDKHVNQTEFRITQIINQAGIDQYGEIDNARVKNSIRTLQSNGQFRTTSTANKYLEAMQAWTRWMIENGRWESDPLDRPFGNGKPSKRRQYRRFKGDTRSTRLRAILSQDEFERLLQVTLTQPVRRNLTGIKRYWLYLIAAQTGLRAQEIHSLTPSNFQLASEAPFVQIENTISKRGKLTGKRDRIHVKVEFASLLKPWLADFPTHQQLFGESRSWWYKAAQMLRKDLKAAKIPAQKQTADGLAEVDFHSFRGLMVTSAMRTGQPQHVAMKVARLSDQRLLERYLTITEKEVADCVEQMPFPNLRQQHDSRTQQ